MKLSLLGPMKQLAGCGMLGLALVLAGLGAGCKEKTETADTPQPVVEETTAATGEQQQTQPARKRNRPARAAAESQPGESASVSGLSGSQAVLDAVDRKQYDAAVTALMQLRATANTQEKQVQWATLVDEVKIKLLEDSSPKALQSLAVLRRVTGGR